MGGQMQGAGSRDADSRRPAHRHVCDAVGHLLPASAAHVALLLRQRELVYEHYLIRQDLHRAHAQLAGGRAGGRRGRDQAGGVFGWRGQCCRSFQFVSTGRRGRRRIRRPITLSGPLVPRGQVRHLLFCERVAVDAHAGELEAGDLVVDLLRHSVDFG